MNLDDDFYQLASRQHALVSRDQAYLLGFTKDMIKHRLATGRWMRETSRVLAVPGAPISQARTAMAAVLEAGPGAVLSGFSAAVLWGLPGFRMKPLHVLQPRGCLVRPFQLGELHTCTTIPPHHVKVLDGIPLCSPTRVVFDIAGNAGATAFHADLVARTLDNAWGRRLLTGALVHDMFDELRGRGRPGISIMREVLAERGRDYVPPESNLERRFHQLIADDRQDPMDRQVDIGGDRWLARVDAVDKRARVIVQINSDRYHTALLDRQKDEAQRAALVALGFAVVTFTEHEVWHDARHVQRTTRHERLVGRERWRVRPAA